MLSSAFLLCIPLMLIEIILIKLRLLGSILSIAMFLLIVTSFILTFLRSSRARSALVVLAEAETVNLM